MNVGILQSGYERLPQFVRAPVSYVANFSDCVFSTKNDLSIEKALEGRVSEKLLKIVSSKALVKAAHVAFVLLVLGAAIYSKVFVISFIGLFAIHCLHRLFSKQAVNPNLPQLDYEKLMKDARSLFPQISDSEQQDRAQSLLAKAQIASGKLADAEATASALHLDKAMTLIDMARISAM